MDAKRSRALVFGALSSFALVVGACESNGDPADDFGEGGNLLGGTSATSGAAGSAGSGGHAGFAAGGAGSAGVSAASGTTGKGGAAGRGGGASGSGGGGRGGSAGSAPRGGRGGAGGFGGEAGSANAGSPGRSGAAGSAGGGDPLPESGCGATSWPTEGEYTLSVGGVARQFTLAVSTDYDPNHPYPVIFSWHGLGGSMGNYYQLNSSARAGNAAIHLSPQGLDNANGDGPGWWNTDGADLAFVDALIEWTEGSFCVDKTRLFSVGFSFGGMFSHLLGCERGDRFRAIAPIAGSFYNYYGFGGEPACEQPVPMLGIHGTADDRVPIADGEAARDVWVAKNGCTTTTENTEPAGCVLYRGCMTGYPVEWCTHDGMHMVPSFAADVIWEFFQGF